MYKTTPGCTACFACTLQLCPDSSANAVPILLLFLQFVYVWLVGELDHLRLQ